MASYFSIIVINPDDWEEYLESQDSLPGVLAVQPRRRPVPRLRGRGERDPPGVLLPVGSGLSAGRRCLASPSRPTPSTRRASSIERRSSMSGASSAGRRSASTRAVPRPEQPLLIRAALAPGAKSGPAASAWPPPASPSRCRGVAPGMPTTPGGRGEGRRPGRIGPDRCSRRADRFAPPMLRVLDLLRVRRSPSSFVRTAPPRWERPGSGRGHSPCDDAASR